MECGSKIDLAGLASHKIDAQIAASAGRLSADELSKMIKRIRDIPEILQITPCGGSDISASCVIRSAAISDGYGHTVVD